MVRRCTPVYFPRCKKAQMKAEYRNPVFDMGENIARPEAHMYMILFEVFLKNIHLIPQDQIVQWQYAVKAQTSLAPLSWFPGSHIPTAHVHQCCRFQSYAKSRRLHAVLHEAKFTKREPHSWDPRQWTTWSRPVTFDFNRFSKLLLFLSFTTINSSNLYATWVIYVPPKVKW